MAGMGSGIAGITEGVWSKRLRFASKSAISRSRDNVNPPDWMKAMIRRSSSLSEPRAVRFAHIDNYLGTVGEMDPIHKLLALWTRDIADLILECHPLLCRNLSRIAEDSCPFLATGADLLKADFINPDP